MPVIKPAHVGRDYDRAGEQYRIYADGDANELYDFDGQYSFGDREIWRVIDINLHELHERQQHLSVLDLGCGPGIWLRRIVGRALQMGFATITARGIDLAELQIRHARVLSQTVIMHRTVSLGFEVGDIRKPLTEADQTVDLCLCLYGVLNHLPAADLPAVFKEVARVTRGQFIATVRGTGSMPTIYVDELKAARTYHQDNDLGQMDIEFLDGKHASLPSKLFTAAELRALASSVLHVDDLSGLDLFHGRFAHDPHWNPPEAAASTGFAQNLRELEHRFCHHPDFMDHATHLLMLARAQGAVSTAQD